MDFPFKVSQDLYNKINQAVLKILKEQGEWRRVTILCNKDQYVCAQCQESEGTVLPINEAEVPPVSNCQNPVCRCVYQAKE